MHRLVSAQRLTLVSVTSLAAFIALACTGETGQDPLDAVLGDGDGDGDTSNPGFLGVGGGTSQGDGDGDGSAWTPPNCSLLTGAGYEVCGSGETYCEAVFRDGSGCNAVCAAAGLTCVAAYEDAEGQCAADDTRPEVACDSGHESDFCVCEGMGAPSLGSGGSVNSGSGGSGSGSGSGGNGPNGTGGASGGSGSGGAGTGGSPNVGPKACGCESSAGNYGEVDSTIKVASGGTYDGQCKVFWANSSTLGDGSQEEGQKPIFELGDGATLRNVIINASGADGIHTTGDATLENVHWWDVGEDALTIKEEGTVSLDCGSAFKGSDKIFQINAPSTFKLSNFTANGAGKLIRQVGGSTWKMTATIDHCDISDMSESVFRTDSSSSHVTFTNSRYHNIDDALFIFGSSEVNGNSSQSTVSNLQAY